MMVFMSLVLGLIGQFCRDVIGRQNVKHFPYQQSVFVLEEERERALLLNM